MASSSVTMNMPMTMALCGLLGKRLMPDCCSVPPHRQARLPADLIPKLLTVFRRKGDHRAEGVSASSCGWLSAASSRSAEARNRSRIGISGTVTPAAICALLRSRLSSHPAGMVARSAVLDMA